MLSEDQTIALEKIDNWYKGNEPYFVLRGYAGTGKTFLLGKIREHIKENLFYTATTNKAAKVLSSILDDTVKTIYSLLGLRLVENEDQLVLERSDKEVYLPAGSVIVVDEASMVPTQLTEIIEETVLMTGVRVIYVGDPAQLPPVGEKFSPVWNITKNEECKAFLKKVMRNDNQLLALATEIRSCMMNRNFVSPIRHNIDENGLGVHLHSSQERFEQHLTSRAKELDWREVKVVAWRNSQVAYYNSIIRYELGYSKPFCKNEVILLARPIERSGQIIAHTDDEFTVVNVSDGSVRVDFNHVNTWHLEAVAGKQTLFLNIPKNQADLDRILSQKASNAKSKKSPTERRRAWTDFWNTKNKFEEVRYGYALTAHRSQGSTLQECYIDQQDILSNFKGIEAYQCLYVACTRPTKVLHTF